MTKIGTHTYREIMSQPGCWAETLAEMTRHKPALQALWQERAWRQVMFTGCGSPYYLALSAATLFRSLTRQVAQAAPASELWLNPMGHLAADDTLLVAISRSGSTTEVLRAVGQFRAAMRGKVIVITCEPDSPLYGRGDINIALPWASEQSIAQTRSFASMYVAAVALAAICAERDDLLAAMDGLPSAGERLLADHGPQMTELASPERFERFYFLGSGLRYGLASEISLKMKEMTLSHSEPFHVLEFRHGPKSMVDERTLVVGLAADVQAAHEQPVFAEMRELGGQTLVLAEDGVNEGHGVALQSGVPELVRGVLYLPALHLLAYERALAKGLDPDNPTNLDAVVRLDDA